MDSPIQSTKNPLIRRFRAAAQGAAPGLMVAEGRRLVREALHSGLAVVEAAWSPKLGTVAGGEELLSELAERAGVVQECSDKVMQRLSMLTTHQGVSVVLRRPQWGFADLLGGGATRALIVVAAGVRDPGNLGALVRSAEAAGATGLLAVEGSADPFRDKALRGSSGSVFRLPVLAGLDATACIAELRGADVRVLAADAADGAQACWDLDLAGPTALVLGAEGAGVPAVFGQAADASVAVPLAEPVDSLNVAVAAGVLLFEARRQRR